MLTKDCTKKHFLRKIGQDKTLIRVYNIYNLGIKLPVFGCLNIRKEENL